MKTKMTKEIQSVIIAVQAYRKFLHADQAVRNRKNHLDYDDLSLKYYCSLNKPAEMKNNLACYRAVIQYPIQETLSAQESELCKFSFGF